MQSDPVSRDLLLRIHHEIVSLSSIDYHRVDYNEHNQIKHDINNRVTLCCCLFNTFYGLNWISITSNYEKCVVVNRQLNRTIQKPVTNHAESIAIALICVNPYFTNAGQQFKKQIQKKQETNLFDIEDGKGHRLVGCQLIARFWKSPFSINNHTRWLVVTVVVMMSNKFGHTHFGQPVRYHHHVFRKIVIIERWMWIFLSTLTHDQGSKDAISTLETYHDPRNDDQMALT